MGQTQSALTGVIELVLISLVPVLLVWSLLHARQGVALARRLGRRLRRRPVDDAPAGRPLEQVASDLRRLASALDTMPPGTPRAKVIGTLMAYDGVLREACAALDVPERLTERAHAVTRDDERSRVELALEIEGLRVRPPEAA